MQPEQFKSVFASLPTEFTERPQAAVEALETMNNNFTYATDQAFARGFRLAGNREFLKSHPELSRELPSLFAKEVGVYYVKFVLPMYDDPSSRLLVGFKKDSRHDGRLYMAYQDKTTDNLHLMASLERRWHKEGYAAWWTHDLQVRNYNIGKLVKLAAELKYQPYFADATRILTDFSQQIDQLELGSGDRLLTPQA